MTIDKQIPFADCFRPFDRDRIVTLLWRLSKHGAPDFEEAPASFRRRLGATLERFRSAHAKDLKQDDWYKMLAAVAGAMGAHLETLEPKNPKQSELATTLRDQIGATTFPGALFLAPEKSNSKRDTHAKALAAMLVFSVPKEEREALVGTKPEISSTDGEDYTDEYNRVCAIVDKGRPICPRLRESLEALPWAGLASGIRNMFSVRDEKHDYSAPKLDGLYETWQPAAVFPGSYVCGSIEFKHLAELGTVLVREEQKHIAKSMPKGPLDRDDQLADPTYGAPSLWEVHIGVAFPRTSFWMIQMTQQRTRHPKHIWYQQYRYSYDPEGDNEDLKYTLLIGEFMTSSEHTRVYKGRTIARRVPIDENGKDIPCTPQIVPPSRVPTFIYRLLEQKDERGPSTAGE